jgi:hypothetical protein
VHTPGAAKTSTTQFDEVKRELETTHKQLSQARTDLALAQHKATDYEQQVCVGPGWLRAQRGVEWGWGAWADVRCIEQQVCVCVYVCCCVMRRVGGGYRGGGGMVRTVQQDVHAQQLSPTVSAASVEPFSA